MIILVFDLDDTLLMSNEYTSYETIKFNRELLNLLNSLNYKKNNIYKWDIWARKKFCT